MQAKVLFYRTHFAPKIFKNFTVKPRNSGLLLQPEFFHYCGVFHDFDGQTP